MLSTTIFIIYLLQSSLLCKKYPQTVGASFLEDRRWRSFRLWNEKAKWKPPHHPADYLKNKKWSLKKTAQLSVFKLICFFKEREKNWGQILKITYLNCICSEKHLLLFLLSTSLGQQCKQLAGEGFYYLKMFICSLYVFQLRILDYVIITYSFSNLRDLLFKKVLVLSHGVENGFLGKTWFRENIQ